MSEERLTTRQTVVLIVAAAGGAVEGRTVMQKLAYFSGIELGSPLGHSAHYYGPYSPKVEDALALAGVAGDLRETAERFASWTGEGEGVKYKYELTEDGQATAEALKSDHQAQWERISKAIATIKDVVPDLNSWTLSSAAKTYLIISESTDEVSEENIPALANRLGWKLSAEDVQQTSDVLRRLGLVEEA